MDYPPVAANAAVDKELRHRIQAGRVAVKNHTGIFRRCFGQVESQWKADETRVTFADFALSEGIFSELRRQFPTDHFCSEESQAGDEVQDLTGRFAWVLDPIDGTNNYALGLPFCAISLGLLEYGAPVYGFVYDLARDTLMQGGPALGTFDGCRKVTVRPNPLDAQSIFGMHFPLGENEVAAVVPLLSRYRVRTLGSATLGLAYAAAGMLDGTLDFRVKVWDIAAAYALLLGAGGEGHFLGDEPPFPLRRFSVRAGYTPYFAGSRGFCETLRKMPELRAAVVRPGPIHGPLG